MCVCLSSDTSSEAALLPPATAYSPHEWAQRPSTRFLRSNNVMIGIRNDEIVYVPFSKAIKNDKPINRELLETLRRLSI